MPNQYRAPDEFTPADFHGCTDDDPAHAHTFDNANPYAPVCALPPLGPQADDPRRTPPEYYEDGSDVADPNDAEPEPATIPGPVTFLALALYRLGLPGNHSGNLTGEDFARVGLSIMGGCIRCEASIAAYNGCPTRAGYWACLDCTSLPDDDGDGFATVDEANRFIFPHEYQWTGPNHD